MRIISTAEIFVELVSHDTLSFDAFILLCILLVVIHEQGFLSNNELIQNLQRAQILSTQQAALALEQLKTHGYCDIYSGLPSDCEDMSLMLANGLRDISIKSYLILERDCRTRHAIYCIVNWLNDIAETSDGVCKLVSHHLYLELLMTLMKTDPYLPSKLRLSLHHLYITLMADQDFKQLAAIAYSKSFAEMATAHAAGIGGSEHSLFGLSVQFLNRESIVIEISANYGFLYQVMDSLTRMLRAVFSHDNLAHPILVHRRFVPLSYSYQKISNL